MKIVSVRITEQPKSLFDAMPKVYATFTDGKERFLFNYYPDEISFTEKELIGLTEEGAHSLKAKKDSEFLWSN